MKNTGIGNYSCVSFFIQTGCAKMKCIMSEYYTARKTKGLYDPKSKLPFKLSRSKIDLFLQCPRCFYIDRRLGVSRPPGFPFSLNIAVDHLLKKEFDIHRAAGRAHPLMDTYGIDAIPFSHGFMAEWRENFVGVRFLHKPTNFLVFGAVDDIWVNPQKELHVVDYKSTSKDGVVSLDAEWQNSYKRQMEVYQWLLRHNNLSVSSTGYFVYCNGKKDREAFDGKLEFDVTIIPYTGLDDWVEKTLIDAHETLCKDTVPKAGKDCDYCEYREAAATVIDELENQKSKSSDKEKSLFE